MDEWETLRRNAKRVEGVLEEKVGAYSRLAQRMHSGGPRRVLLRCVVPRFYRIFYHVLLPLLCLHYTLAPPSFRRHQRHPLDSLTLSHLWIITCRHV